MIDQILAAYAGREDQLFSELEARYGPAQKPAPAASAPSKGRAAKVAAPQSAGKYFSQENPVIREITQRVQTIYSEKMKPIEETYMYDKFYETLMNDNDFEAKPMVLLIGQYSVGKTSFIRYLLECDYQGMRVGPEPTTDKFISVMYGDVERVIPGNAASVSADLPFNSLQQFGSGFLNRFEVVQVPSPVLQSITFIDTPGVLSGEKQRLNRTYDFAEVIHYFADRADRILILFDAHKLDISDEMKAAIEALHGNDDKVRVVLNKADAVDKQQLMRIYGALMWSLGRVIRNPEVTRVYLGSFWDQPLRYDYFKDLFAVEQMDLFADLRGLPANSMLRKINDLVRRAHVSKAHALLLSYLRKQIPKMFGKQKKQQELIDNMSDIFHMIQTEYRLPSSDFPPMDRFVEVVANMDFSTFPKFKPELFDALDEVLAHDIPEIMSMLPKPQDDAGAETEPENPFAEIELQKGTATWRVTSAHKAECDNVFATLKQINGKASGSAVKAVLMKTDLDMTDLRKIWELADIDADGKMDAGEFAVAMWLANEKMAGKPLPDTLPEDLIPPSKRSTHVF
ncbi:hypothetical protein JH06_0753 [Blastocystis sp. subtype 4]|uniref:hypothetical protein n=1 Tax=Blastocystis sp. subtype 4 TaxID=944170 RepID=UPI00071130A1|nr:hypothetical protein JH06_0753 [Blastocystis sp. subtype 4]KNB45715.1 hypothetical protein JH06_0753 [Blastocystis sp. subtype 4]|eukprot:XP_014529158.1 hypothetical protein JH06_0753 [Blastocystis sp. subtype 4]